MSIISASTTTTTALQYTADTTGTLVFKTGATPTTALTLNADQSATFAGTVNFATAGFTNLSYTGTLTGGTGVVNLGSGQFYKDASGNVGIGTNSPTATLNVLTTTAFTWATSSTFASGVEFGTRATGAGYVFNTPSLTSVYPSGLAIDGTYNSGTSASIVNLKAFGVYSGGPYASAMTFSTTLGTSTIERMRIDTSGNVGIGTDSPTVKLQVQGADAKFNATSGSFAHYVETASTSGGNTASIRLKANIYNYGIYVPDNANNLVFYDYAQSLERMRIDGFGNVGIGGTTGSAKFSVLGRDVSGTTARFATSDYANGVAGSGLQIDTGAATGNTYTRLSAFSAGFLAWNNLILQEGGGNVGIGTTNPTVKLAVYANNGKMSISSSTDASGITMGQWDSTTNRIETSVRPLQFAFYNSQPCIFSPNGSEAMRIASNGYVGIGTSSPGSLLTVNGTAAATTLYAASSVQIVGNGGNNDPYGTCAVSQPAGASNYSYFGLTRNGQIGAGFGLTGSTGALGLAANSFWFGPATPGASGVMGSAWLAFNSTNLNCTGVVTQSYSDDKLKTKLGNIENALEKLRKIDGFYYEANDIAQGLGYQAGREVGVSAQAVQAVLPEVVVPAPVDDQYLTVRYERLSALIIEAVKELANEVDLIKKQLG